MMIKDSIVDWLLFDCETTGCYQTVGFQKSEEVDVNCPKQIVSSEISPEVNKDEEEDKNDVIII